MLCRSQPSSFTKHQAVFLILSFLPDITLGGILSLASPAWPCLPPPPSTSTSGSIPPPSTPTCGGRVHRPLTNRAGARPQVRQETPHAFWEQQVAHLGKCTLGSSLFPKLLL